MSKREELHRISNDPDYIHSQRYGNSLKALLDHHPDGVSDNVICKALCITQKELDEIYHSAIVKLQEGMKQDE